MKKFLKIFGLVVVVGLFSIQSAWAIKCLPHQVKAGETVMSIARDYSVDPKNSIIRKINNSTTFYLKTNHRLSPGETVYIVEERIGSFLETTPKTERSSSALPSQNKPGSVKSDVATVEEKRSSIPKKKTGFKASSAEADDIYANFGYYKQSEWDDNDRSGQGFYGKIRVPVAEYSGKNRDWAISPQGSFYKGKVNVKDNTYNYQGIGPGVHAESYKDGQNISGEINSIFHKTEKENSPQKQTSVLLKSSVSYEDQRPRKTGRKAFPSRYISASYQHMLTADPKGGAKEYDESEFSVNLRQDIYDVSLGETDMTLVPNVNLGGGYNWGKEDAYGKFGPGAKLRGKNGDLVEARFFNPKIYKDVSSADILERFSISIRPGNLYHEWRASQVKDDPASIKEALREDVSENSLPEHSPAMEGR
jgi:hypothetical protein